MCEVSIQERPWTLRFCQAMILNSKGKATDASNCAGRSGQKVPAARWESIVSPMSMRDARVVGPGTDTPQESLAAALRNLLVCWSRRIGMFVRTLLGLAAL